MSVIPADPAASALAKDKPGNINLMMSVMGEQVGINMADGLSPEELAKMIDGLKEAPMFKAVFGLVEELTGFNADGLLEKGFQSLQETIAKAAAANNGPSQPAAAPAAASPASPAS